MRILKTVILCLAFVVAVFLCSANVHSVQLHYIPDIGLPQLGEPQSLNLPLFLLVLGSVALGLVLGGGGALFEQTRLRLELRQAKKAADRYHDQALSSDSELGVEREEVARLKAQPTTLRRERDALLEPPTEPAAETAPAAAEMAPAAAMAADEPEERAGEDAPFEAAPSDEDDEREQDKT
jgi:uncharacterized integral membrane protein